MPEFLNGNESIARGALDAGCDFFAGYPITPATQILLILAKELPRRGGILLQGEDEIASMGFCIGAALTGRRVMTATSGPGISLYSENIGFGIMAEVPMVIVDIQRMGPSTGAATTGAQGDVQFLRWGTSGGYPVIVLTPASVRDCYTLTLQAFDLAERFRCPVFVAADKETALTRVSVELPEPGSIPTRERGMASAESEFIPYRAEALDQVPPMTFFGGPHILRATSSSHNESAYLTKDPATLDALNRRLAAKIEDHVDEISMVEADLQDNARTLIISYGISARAARAAVLEARQHGKTVSLLTLSTIWPVPENEIRAALRGVKTVLVPELNLGQYRREIERLTSDHQDVIGVNRVDGRLITPRQILEEGGLL